jgi:hypothetical protein
MEYRKNLCVLSISHGSYDWGTSLDHLGKLAILGDALRL